jgi:hypothetical protein
MEAYMLRTGKDQEVVGLVVERVAVDVVDDLVATELSAFTLFDNLTVFRDSLPVDRKETVTLLDPPTTAIESCIVAAPKASWLSCRADVCDCAATTSAAGFGVCHHPLRA